MPSSCLHPGHDCLHICPTLYLISVNSENRKTTRMISSFTASNNGNDQLHYYVTVGKSSISSCTPRSATSLPAIPKADEPPKVVDYEELSCASVWSRRSLVRPWHRVHTSLNAPIEKLFLGANQQITRY